MKIIVLESDSSFGLSSHNLEEYENLGEVYSDNFKDVNDEKKIIEKLQGFDIAVINKTKLTRNIIENLPDLKFVSISATGFDNIDVQACKENGILVSNTPGYGAEAVAQHALALLLEVTNKVGHYTRKIKDGGWSKEGKWQYIENPLYHLAGKTLGIYGYGNIGKQMAKQALGMGMKVLANSIDSQKSDVEGVELVSLEEVFKQSDVISIHAPSTDLTRGSINKKSISTMKDGVIIINTGRGDIIVEKDLAEALQTGKIYGAGLDVFNIEPINDDNPLLKLDNCVMTGHISSATLECYNKLVEISMDNVKNFVSGNFQNVVNK